MENFVEYLKSQIGEKSLGYIETVSGVTKSYISKILRGERKSPPKPDTLKKLAKALPCSYEELMIASGYKENDNIKNTKMLPVLGVIPAGIPIEAIEDIEDYIDINPKFSDISMYFALKVKGDSMNPRILDGDVIIVKKQNDAETGDICVVMVNGYDATVKKIKKENSGLWLIPINPAFPTKFYSNQDITEIPVRIIGKAIEIRSNL